jgi:hypothetical protein
MLQIPKDSIHQIVTAPKSSNHRKRLCAELVIWDRGSILYSLSLGYRGLSRGYHNSQGLLSRGKARKVYREKLAITINIVHKGNEMYVFHYCADHPVSIRLYLGKIRI